MSDGLVTIGITAFNAEDSIEEAISSALGQTYKNIEIIVFDDASEDSTFEKLQKFLVNEKIRVIRSDRNVGVAAARNKIITEALGEFIAFFDDDDVSLPTRVFKQLFALKQAEIKYSQTSLIVCHTTRSQFKSGKLKRAVYPIGMGRSDYCGHNLARALLTGFGPFWFYGSTATCCQFARKSTYQYVGGFNELYRRSEDTEFALSFAKVGGCFVGLHEQLVKQTLTSGEDKPVSMEVYYQKMILHDHQDLLKNNKEYNFCLNYLELKSLISLRYFVRSISLMLRLMSFYPLMTVRRLIWILFGKLSIIFLRLRKLN